jgi:hypothetical protein
LRIILIKRIAVWAVLAVILGAAFPLAPVSSAQGCVMCQTSATAAGKAGERALDKAILTLLLPPLTMFLLILGFAWKRSRAISHANEKLTRRMVTPPKVILHLP